MVVVFAVVVAAGSVGLVIVGVLDGTWSVRTSIYALSAVMLAGLAAAWEERNRVAFLEGYLGHEGIDALLPADGDSRATLLAGFELDNGERAERSLHSPRAHRMSGSDDEAVAINEGDVDCEFHEERVDAATRREDERTVGGETGPA